MIFLHVYYSEVEQEIGDQPTHDQQRYAAKIEAAKKTQNALRMRRQSVVKSRKCHAQNSRNEKKRNHCLFLDWSDEIQTPRKKANHKGEAQHGGEQMCLPGLENGEFFKNSKIFQKWENFSIIGKNFKKWKNF